MAAAQVAYDISAQMEYGAKSLADAACSTVHRRLPSDSGGVIAVNREGEIVMPFNSAGMFRASTNSATRQIKMGIWEEEVDIFII